MVKLFEQFNDDKKLEQDISDILVELSDMRINFNIDITNDRFRRILNKCNIVIDITGSSLSDRNILFDNKYVYPIFMMLGDYLKEKYNASLISIYYYASVNGGIFTEIPDDENIRLISSIRIKYVCDEN